MTALLIAVGGAAGALLRHLLDRWIRDRYGPAFPWATLAVNVFGSFALGLLTGLVLGGGSDGLAVLRPLLGTGLCGALTTFSTFGYETVRLLSPGTRLLALVNVLGTVVGGLIAGACGLALVAMV